MGAKTSGGADSLAFSPVDLQQARVTTSKVETVKFSSGATPATDTIDASASSSMLMIDGNEGDDLITMLITSHAAGNDLLNGQGGDDRIFGDSGNDNDPAGDAIFEDGP